MNESVEDALKRRQKLWWLAAVNKLGSAITAIWLLWVVFDSSGLLHMLVTAIFLAILLRPGPALVFIVASSALHFYYSVAGLWLPLLSYCSAALALVLDWRLVRLIDREHDLDAGIVDDKIVDWKKFANATWNEQLAGIVAECGMHNPEIDICIYPQNTIDHTAQPLFSARPDEYEETLARLQSEYRSGQFSVIVFVRGEIRRRFTLLIMPSAADQP